MRNKNPDNPRPRVAINAIRAWAEGKDKLGMAKVRQLSLDAHTAARGAKTDKARFVARAAGQAIASWHVPNHAPAVPYYVKKSLAEK
ncbi:MAG: putative immunity protein [bacterium]